MNLKAVLQNRRWERHDYPFRYVYAQGVFTDDFYRQLESQFRDRLAVGLNDELRPLPLTEKQFYSARQGGGLTGYAAYGAGIQPEETGPFALFKSPEWHDMMGSLFDVEGTGHILAGMHHHLIDSKSYLIHNDLTPAWFAESEGIRLPDMGACNYVTGDGTAEKKVMLCRAVVVILYLCNGEWHEGYGGETAFYNKKRTPIDSWAVKIPPYDNSLVMFECTQKTWHSFLPNRAKPRNNLIMWIHRPVRDGEKLEGYYPVDKADPRLTG